jgi:hypothetical protein
MEIREVRRIYDAIDPAVVAIRLRADCPKCGWRGFAWHCLGF